MHFCKLEILKLSSHKCQAITLVFGVCTHDNENVNIVVKLGIFMDAVVSFISCNEIQMTWPLYDKSGPNWLYRNQITDLVSALTQQQYHMMYF
jgi:hypothetical protein